MSEFTIRDRPSRDGLRAGIATTVFSMVLLVIFGATEGVVRETAFLLSVSLYMTFTVLAILESARQKQILGSASQSPE